MAMMMPTLTTLRQGPTGTAMDTTEGVAAPTGLVVDPAADLG